jgi:hypothetical protein
MSLVWLVVAVLFPSCGTWQLIAIVTGHLPRTTATQFLRLVLAPVFGLGLSSALYFLWLFAIGNPAGEYQIVESLFWLLLMLLCRRHNQNQDVWRERPPVPVPANSGLSRFIVAVFSLAMASATAGLIGQAAVHPAGCWDAWAIWNLRARFLFRLGNEWRDSLAAAFGHADYPLLVPATLARFWTFLGSDSECAGPAAGILFTLATVAVAGAAIAVRQGRNAGLLASMVLAGAASFLRWGGSQYADAPLALYFLTTLTLLVLHNDAASRADKPDGRPLLLLAGLAAGLAAWTKNEGCAFLPAVLLAYAAVTSLWRGWITALKEGLVILAGAAPLVLVVLLFKAQVETTNDLVAGQGFAESTARMFDPARHLTIVTAFLTEGIQLIQGFSVAVPLAFVLLGRRRVPASGSFTLAAAVIGLMLAAYYATYLVTPYDVSWHMATSLDRLLLHLWPMTVLAVFLQLRSPEDALKPSICHPTLREATNGSTCRSSGSGSVSPNTVQSPAGTLSSGARPAGRL